MNTFITWLLKCIYFSSVGDPHFNAYPDSGAWWPKIVKFYSWKKSLKRQYNYFWASMINVQATIEASSHHKRLSNISKHKYKIFSFFGSFLPSWTGSGSIRPKSIWIHGDLEQDCQHRIFVLSSMKQVFFGSPIVITETSQPASTYILNKENTPPPPR